MDLVVQCVMFFHIINMCQATATEANIALPTGGFKKWLQRSPIGSVLKTTGSCKFSFKISDPTWPLESPLEIYPDELNSLTERNTTISTIYLPHKLLHFNHFGIPKCPTQIIIDQVSTYKLEHIILENLPALPVNIGRLHSLKQFICRMIYGTIIDFTILTNMKQLEKIITTAVAGVTLSHSLHLPALRELVIYDSPIAFFNNVTCSFPKLVSLYLCNNSLEVIPHFFRNFIALTELKITQNRLQRITLDTFGAMKQLESLELSHNRILAIATQNRVELPSLTNLYLDNNRLAVLDVTLWIAPKLKYLKLNSNQLVQVAGLLTLLNEKVETLQMYDNPWNCEWLNEVALKLPGAKIIVSIIGPC